MAESGQRKGLLHWASIVGGALTTVAVIATVTTSYNRLVDEQSDLLDEIRRNRQQISELQAVDQETEKALTSIDKAADRAESKILTLETRQNEISDRTFTNLNNIFEIGTRVKDAEAKALIGIDAALHKSISDLRRVGFEHLQFVNNSEFHPGFAFFAYQNTSGTIYYKNRGHFRFQSGEQLSSENTTRFPIQGDILIVAENRRIRDKPHPGGETKGQAKETDRLFVIDACAGPYNKDPEPVRRIWIEVASPKLDALTKPKDTEDEDSISTKGEAAGLPVLESCSSKYSI